MYPARLACVAILALLCSAQESRTPPSASPGAEYSGMYSFLREGEFVQITVDEGRVSGFVSRYGDRESDRGAFLDHFFKAGKSKLDGNLLTFETETVHGVWFEFRGAFERGEGKKGGDEAFYVLKGRLTEYSTDESQKTSSRSRQVALKSFPGDSSPPPPKKD